MSNVKLVRRAMAAGAGLLVLMAALPPSAGALDADPITVQPGQSVSVDYGPIPGNDPATPQILGPVAPDVCQLSPSCNLIPLEFATPPGFSAEDDTYLAELTLTWESVPVGDRNAGAASNDLDLYVWAAEYLETEPGEPCETEPEGAPEDYEPPEYCSTNLAKSAGPLPPERVRFDATAKQKYLLVINNATGPNIGYHIDITSRYERFENPIGIPDTDFVPPTPTNNSTSTPSSSSFGSGSFDDLSPDAGLGGTSLSLEPFPADADADLAGLEGAGLPGANFLRRPAASAGPAKPVSGATVALWLALLPIVLGGGAAYWFVRRRPSALRISFPTTNPA